MQKINLNGTWDFVVDLDPKYHLDTRIWKLPEFASPSANRKHWLKVDVPGVWQKYGERYDIFEGVCWFAREFDVPDGLENCSARLRFGAVNYLCRVFVNGKEIGGHETGYTEFVLDTTGDLKPGVNHVAVMVDNRSTSVKWPPCLGYFNYGGIHRSVSLEIIDRSGLDELQVSARSIDTGGRLTVQGKVVLVDHDSCEVFVTCAGETVGVIPGCDGSFCADLDVPGVQAWSPASPTLYDVTVDIRKDKSTLEAKTLSCGFRMIEVKNGGIYLNGEPIKLNGICYVYDSPETGLVMTPAQVKQDVALMKELGCNAVRCHYPMDNVFYHACDRAGLLVWIEPMVYCLHPGDDEHDTPFSDPASVALAERVVVEMIATARNHPCVAIYGIGNECNTRNPEAEPFFRSLAGAVRREDDSRLVSYAALYGLVGPISDMVDVVGINSYWGWYDRIYGGKGLSPDKNAEIESIDLGKMREMLDEPLKKDPSRLLLLTEFGADSVPGFLSNKHELWSEEYHADLLRETLSVSREYPRIVGTFPFGFSDYRDPSKIHNGFWNELNLKGVVTYERKKKLAFEALRMEYHKTADAVL